jgi:hypothetical protein
MPEEARMTTEIVRVDCDSREDVQEALRHLSATAGRMLHHADNGSWVRCHERMNVLLDDLDRIEAAEA